VKKVIKSDQGLHNVTVETDGEESICIWQEEDLVMLFNERMARKTIRALKKAAKEFGWEV
jgi:hypothetical protein